MLHPTPQALSFPMQRGWVNHAQASARRAANGSAIATAPRAKPGVNLLKPPRIRLAAR